MAGVSATMGRDIIVLSDDALIIDDDVRAPLNKGDRLVAMPARLIDKTPNYRETDIASFLK
jgi:hypothetical protein